MATDIRFDFGDDGVAYVVDSYVKGAMVRSEFSRAESGYPFKWNPAFRNTIYLGKQAGLYAEGHFDDEDEMEMEFRNEVDRIVRLINYESLHLAIDRCFRSKGWHPIKQPLSVACRVNNQLDKFCHEARWHPETPLWSEFARLIH